MTRARVLIAVRDDGAEVRRLEECLQRLGYVVCAVVRSVRQSVESAVETAPDVAYIDLDPQAGMDVFEAAERIGSRFDIPVICLADAVDGNLFEPARTSQPFGCTLKPFEERQLHLDIQTALFHYRREGEHREARSGMECRIDEMRNRIETMGVIFNSMEEGGKKETEARPRQVMSEVTEQREFLQTIFDSIQDGIVVGSDKGEFLYGNRGAAEILGDDYIVRRQGNWWEEAARVFFYPDRVTPVRMEDLPLPRAVINGESIDDQVLFLKRAGEADGGRYIRFSARPLRHEFGGIRRAVMTLRDVTDQVNAEEALMQAFAQGRLEVVETIVHNIGNAINSVTTGVETLRRQVAKNPIVGRISALADAAKAHEDDWIDYLDRDPQGSKVRPFMIALAKDCVVMQRRWSKTIDRVSDRANHIADIVRTEKALGNTRVVRKDVDLPGAIGFAIKVVQDAYGKVMPRIRVDCENAPKRIRIQESPFQQMLVNLIKNALEAVDERARSGGAEARPRVEVRACIDGDFLKLDVSDNGIGVAEKDTGMLFAAGYSTKDSGTGLGLHSAANFVIGLGGRIQLLSDGIGKGATTRVMLRLSSITSMARR